ncbi:histone-like nucleoid-structuring protein Lsr2 [Saccharopolyspora sp. NPDC049357]|uniref:Lsr2 dimerization domain-containing protein n=1 Tax=Saccharopolyspora sp. NPDC049357 TaxID=3154507 RepID=UPI0034366EDF
MGTRQIRYCDISGTEHDVETHEINIDQMRVEIDLAADEYRKLLQLLRPYLDAGRIEASMPDLPQHTTTPRRTTRPRGKRGSDLSPQERTQLRQWAEEKGLPVPVNNQFKRTVIDQWREETTNPSHHTPPHSTPSPAETPATAAKTNAAPAAEPEPTDTAQDQTLPSRRDRISQVLLAKPRTWMTVTQITNLTKQGTSDTIERNATSELLRRMANDGQAERDDSTRPIRYKATAHTTTTSPDAMLPR